MKPFNFEEFKAGKPALLDGNKIEFIAYDEDFEYPVLCKETYQKTKRKVLYNTTLKHLKDNATMLTTKREVWIAIGKYISNGHIEPFSISFKSKELALSYKHVGWQVIDAIPYTIEE